MTDKEMNKLADMIVDKLLTTYIREQATWYTTSTMDDIYNTDEDVSLTGNVLENDTDIENDEL